MNTRRCEHCDKHLGARHAHNARFCSGRCRTAACRKRRSIPAELTKRPRWIRRSVHKVPLTVDRRPASSTDPVTWSRYRDAVKSTVGTGLGFVLDGDGVVCLDLDHCLDDQGDALLWAQRILDEAGPTWVERSVSGRGLHVWGTGVLPRGRRITVGSGSVEIYATGRYIAITGQTFGAARPRLSDVQHLIDELLL